jgi:hypothetical protein
MTLQCEHGTWKIVETGKWDFADAVIYLRQNVGQGNPHFIGDGVLFASFAVVKSGDAERFIVINAPYEPLSQLDSVYGKGSAPVFRPETAKITQYTIEDVIPLVQQAQEERMRR